MGSETFDDEAALTAAGGADDTHEQTARVDSARIAVQADIGGDSQDFDFVVDVRLAADADWVRDFESLKNKSTPFNDLIRIDAEAIREVRARIVNQDGSNAVDSRLIGRSGTQG